MSAVAIQNAMLNGLRQHIPEMVIKAQYKVSSTWYDAEFTSSVQTNNMVHVDMMVEPVAGPGTVVTQFRLLDSSDNELAGKTQTLTFAAGIDSILFRFAFEVTVDEGDDT